MNSHRGNLNFDPKHLVDGWRWAHKQTETLTLTVNLSEREVGANTDKVVNVNYEKWLHDVKSLLSFIIVCVLYLLLLMAEKPSCVSCI